MGSQEFCSVGRQLVYSASLISMASATGGIEAGRCHDLPAHQPNRCRISSPNSESYRNRLKVTSSGFFMEIWKSTRLCDENGSIDGSVDGEVSQSMEGLS